MIFFLLRLSLLVIGVTFLAVFIISFIILIKTIYLSDIQLGAHLFNNYEKCNEGFVITNKDLCERIATSYWMIVISIASLVISFITLFPVFIMRKK
tara:strand:+ start:234 stop:521 length:288 start_codon:yes stop_codon:yes gene_type:complete